MDVGKDMHHPVAEVHLGSLAASQQGVKHGGILRGVMVSGKQVIFSSKTEASQRIFRQIIKTFG